MSSISKSDFKDYTKPFSLATGSSLNGVYDQRTYQKRKVFLKQIISETDDGVIFRDKREDKGLTYKNMEYKQKPRFGAVLPFGSVTFELEKTVLVVQRRYPTFIDMIAKFGGLARVITFFIFSFVSVHHLIVMERYLLNEAILQRRKLEESKQERKLAGMISLQPHSEEVEPFSYLEVLRYKFLFFCVGKSPRFSEYEKSVKVITQRMDAQSIVTNSGNISLLSSSLLKPYQMALIQELNKTNLKMDLSTKSVPLREALDQLNTNSSQDSRSLISKKIDEFLRRMQIGESEITNNGELNPETQQNGGYKSTDESLLKEVGGKT